MFEGGFILFWLYTNLFHLVKWNDSSDTQGDTKLLNKLYPDMLCWS